MKVFVTGGSGFLGRHLVLALEQEGHDVEARSSRACDLTRDGSLAEVEGDFDEIWHLAARGEPGGAASRAAGDHWIANQRINTNVLDWWQRRQPRARLIAVGTSHAYAPGSEPREEHYLTGEPVPEIRADCMTKRMLLVGLRALALQHGLRYRYLVPSMLFGPGYRVGARQPPFIADLIRRIARGAADGSPAILRGDGHQTSELVYVDDFIRVALALARGEGPDIVNVGSGIDRPMRWYAEQISELFGYENWRIQYDTTQQLGIPSRRLVLDRLRELVPTFEPTPLDVALEFTVRDYLGTASPTCLEETRA